MLSSTTIPANTTCWHEARWKHIVLLHLKRCSLLRKHIQDMKTLIHTEQVVNILLIWQGSVKNSAVSVNTLISAVLLFDKLILRIRARGGNVYGL